MTCRIRDFSLLSDYLIQEPAPHPSELHRTESGFLEIRKLHRWEFTIVGDFSGAKVRYFPGGVSSCGLFRKRL